MPDRTSRLHEAAKQIQLSKEEVEDTDISQSLGQALESVQIALNHIEDEPDTYQYLPDEKK